MDKVQYINHTGERRGEGGGGGGEGRGGGNGGRDGWGDVEKKEGKMIRRTPRSTQLPYTTIIRYTTKRTVSLVKAVSQALKFVFEV